MSLAFTPLILTHVGPHKTGTTALQRALYTHRDILAKHGIWYPESVNGAGFVESHSDLALMLLHGDRGGFEAWLKESWEDAQASHCRILLLSSEEFSHPVARTPLVALLNSFSIAHGCQWRTVFVDRALKDLIRSNLAHHLTSDLNQVCMMARGIRMYTTALAQYIAATRGFFESIQSQFLTYETFSREGLAREFLRDAAGIHIACISSKDLNSEEQHLEDPRAWLTMTLRMMISAYSDATPASPEVAREASDVVRHVILDERAFRNVFYNFMQHAREQIDLGIEDVIRADARGGAGDTPK